LLDRLFDSIKYWQSLNGLARLSWRYTADHFRAVLFATFGVERSGFTRDTLTDDSRIAINKNTHNLLILGSLVLMNAIGIAIGI